MNAQVYKLILLVVGICFLLFPNNNPTLDAWEYACNVKYGTELFRSHHLLYNWLMYSIKSIPVFDAFDTLKFMQFVNGAFAITALWLLYRVLILLNHDVKRALVWVFWTASSFACMRYATENETYIIPITLSMAASYLFLRFCRNQQKIGLLLFSGALAATSCLFHQIHFFWWLALLVGAYLLPAKQKWKHVLIYMLPSLVVPLVYLLVLCFYEQEEPNLKNLLSFVFDYYYSHKTAGGIDKLNFIMTPISFFRTFFQIHGNLVNFFIARPILSSLALISVAFCFIRFLFPWNFKFSLHSSSSFVRVHGAAFVLQFLFAFYSKGNAEFMVMLPFLLAICLSSWLNIDERKIFYCACAMFIWNMTFAVLPYHFYNLQNNDRLVEAVHENPNKKFIFDERHKVVTKYRYTYGADVSSRVFFPSDIRDKGRSGVYFTDVLSKVKPYSRASLVLNRKLNFEYDKVGELTEVTAFYGDYRIDEIWVE